MKKAIALLLALALVGGAVFAEGLEITAGAAGSAQIFNNGTDTFLDSNATFYADFDFVDEAGKFGFAAEMEWAAFETAGYAGNAGSQDGGPFFNYAYGFANLLDGMVKVNMGNLWKTNYRFRNSMLNLLGGAAIAGNGVAVEVMPIEGLSAAVFLPYPATRNLLNGNNVTTILMSDTLKEIDFLAKYAMDGVGTFYTSYRMQADTATPVTGGAVFNLGANITALGAPVTAQFGYTASKIGHDTEDMLSTINLVGGYKIDAALSVLEEVNLTLGDDLLWLSQTFVAYRPADVRYSLAFRIWNDTTTIDDINMRITPAARFYSGANFWNVAFQYDVVGAGDNTWRIPVSYSIEF